MSVPHYGDFAEDDVVNIIFNTFTSDDPAISATVTNLVDADIKVHKDGGITQIATDGAVIAIDFDGVTGNHMITIDTSAHADYSVGSEYAVRIEGVTIDGGANINAWVGSFSIERAGGILAIAKLIQAAVITNAAGTDVAADIIALKAETALILTDTAEIGAAGAGLTAINLPDQTMNITGNLSGSVGSVTGAVGSVTGHTNQTGDTYALANGAAGFAAINTDVELILADTNELQTDDYPTTIAALQTDLDTLTAGVTLTAASVDLIWDEAQADHVSVGSFGEVATEVAAILSDTGELQTDWVNGGRLDLLLDTAAGNVPPTVSDITDGVWDRDATTNQTAGTFGEALGDPAASGSSVRDLISTAQSDLDTITGSDGVTLATAQGLYAPSVAGDAMSLTGDLTATMKSSVNAEMDTSLTDIHLDHLMPAAAADVIVDGSVIAHMVSATEDWSSFVPSTDSLQAIRDRGDADWSAAGSAPDLLQSTTIATLASQVSFTLTAGSADNDAYNDAVAIVTDSATATQKAVGSVSDYVGATKTITLSADPAIFTMAIGDTIDLIANVAAATDNAAIADAVWDEAQADHVAVGSMGLIASETGDIKAVTDALPDSGALTTIDSVVDAIKVKTDFLPSITAGSAGGVFIAGTNAATVITGSLTTAFTGNLTGDVQGNVDGTVASVVGNVGGDISGDVTGFSTAAKAEIESEVNDGLVALNLDHLCFTATGIPTLPVGTFLEARSLPAASYFDPAADAVATVTSVTTVTGNVDGSVASVSGAVGSVTGAVGSVTGAVGSVAGNVDGNVAGSVGSVTGNLGGNVVGTLAGFSTAAKAEINTEVSDVLTVDTNPEPSAIPAANASIASKIGWLYTLGRNRITQTATTQTLKADDTTTTIASAALSDSAGTATRGEWS